MHHMFNHQVIQASVYQKAMEILGNNHHNEPEEESLNGHQFQPLVGVIKVEDQLTMKRMVFRVSHGKAYV